jgi:Zn/Cd-binding protein ZinT
LANLTNTKLIIPSVFKVGGKALTEHNRSPVSISYSVIENSKRMANGTMRKFVVASKKTFSTSWSMLPGLKSQSVDYAGSSSNSELLGAMDIKAFYESNYGTALNLIMYAGSTTSSTKRNQDSQTATFNGTVFISDFSCTLNKRLGNIDYWDVSISFEEA